ncbi:MAG: hypothetical protein NTX88_06475, partial [Candidatus Atribacteria bacterium]|nr:hypothetical protein [Candidatus Atribacteria bacterium]
MQEGNLFKKYTMQSLLDEFDVIECFEQPGSERRWGGNDQAADRALLCNGNHASLVTIVREGRR